MREQLLQPASILRLSLREVAYAHLEVFPVGVHRANHHLVTKHKLQVDLVCRYFDRAVAAGHAGKDEYAVLTQCLHALEHHRREPCGLEDDIEGPRLLRTHEKRDLSDRLILSTQGFDQVRVEIRSATQSEGRHL